jgi:hypothetical protein
MCRDLERARTICQWRIAHDLVFTCFGFLGARNGKVGVRSRRWVFETLTFKISMIISFLIKSEGHIGKRKETQPRRESGSVGDGTGNQEAKAMMSVRMKLR